MKRLLTWIVDHPWPVIAVVVLATAGFLFAIPGTQVNTDFESYIDHEDPAYVAKERAEARFGSSEILMIALVEPDGIYNTDVLAVIEEVTLRIEALPGIDDVQTPLNAQLIEATDDSLQVGPVSRDGIAPTTAGEIETFRRRIESSDLLVNMLVSEDGRAANMLITYAAAADGAELTRQITAIVDEYRDRHAFYLSGMYFMPQSMSESMATDLGTLLPVVLLVIILVLYGSFRSLRGVAIPLLVVLLSLIWAFGFMGLTNVAVTAVSFILPILLLAIGIAYGIHILSHVNERMAAGDEKRDALLTAMGHIHAPVLMTGLTTVAGFMALMTSFLPVLAEFGLTAGIGVIIAMILSLLLIPALLSVLRPPKVRANIHRDGRVERGLRRWGQFVSQHSGKIVIASVGVLLLFAIGIPFMPIDSSISAFLGSRHTAVQGMEIMEAYFSGSEQIVIEIDTGQRNGLKEPAVLREMLALEDYLKEIGVHETTSITNVIRDLNEKFHGNDPQYDAIPEDRKLVSQLLLLFSFQGGDLGSLALGDFSAGEIVGFYPKYNQKELSVLVASIQSYLATQLGEGLQGSMVGSTVLKYRMTTQLVSSQLISLATSVVIAAAIVALLMGSLIAGLIAVVPLVFAIVLNFGTMGFAGMTLNIATAMISSITIGIGIDYAIHFISRYKKEYQTRQCASEAAVEAMATSGQAILFNAIAVISGFIVLLFSAFSAFKSFGGLISLSMAVSAISALTVIPALFARWSPRFLTRQRRTARGAEPKRSSSDRHEI